MAGATGAVAFLPGYAAIGLLAPLAMMALRATQGLAAGGELGVAAVFLMEHAPDQRRGQTASWHIATMAFGIAVGMLVVGLLSWWVGPGRQRFAGTAVRGADHGRRRRRRGVVDRHGG